MHSNWQLRLMVVRTALACFSWRRRQPVLQVMEYLTHAACLSTGASVHFVYRPFTYYRRLSCSDGLQGKKKSHPPTARGGVAKSNIQTGVGVVRLPSSLLPFLSAPFTPHWLIAIGVCPFSLVPTYVLHVLSYVCTMFLTIEIKLLSSFNYTIALFSPL